MGARGEQGMWKDKEDCIDHMMCCHAMLMTAGDIVMVLCSRIFKFLRTIKWQPACRCDTRLDIPSHWRLRQPAVTPAACDQAHAS